MDMVDQNDVSSNNIGYYIIIKYDYVYTNLEFSK